MSEDPRKYLVDPMGLPHTADVKSISESLGCLAIMAVLGLIGAFFASAAAISTLRRIAEALEASQ